MHIGYLKMPILGPRGNEMLPLGRFVTGIVTMEHADICSPRVRRFQSHNHGLQDVFLRSSTV